MRPRRSPESKAMDARKDALAAELIAAHPEVKRGDIVWSRHERKLVAQVPGTDISYQDALPHTDPVEAAFSSEAR